MQRKPSAELQYKELMTELLALLNRCMTNDAKSRPTADQLVAECTKLCYPPSARLTGTMISVATGGTYGRIQSDDAGQIFFHRDSLYGDRLEAQDRVCFAAFPGTPNPRAHPIVKLQTPSDGAIAAGA